MIGAIFTVYPAEKKGDAVEPDPFQPGLQPQSWSGSEVGRYNASGNVVAYQVLDFC